LFEVFSESKEVSQVGGETGMNRAERRRLAKGQQKKPAVYNFTEGQLKEKISKGVLDFKKDLVEDIINKVTNDYITLTLNVLYDEFDFDCEQLKKFKQRLDCLSDSVTEDYVTIDDIKLMLLEELGFNLYALGKNETAQKDVLLKADSHKKNILYSGMWLMYISVLKVLSEHYKFGSKRGTDFTAKLNKYLEEYLEDISLVQRDVKDIYYDGKFKDSFMYIDCTKRKAANDENLVKW